MSEKEMVIPDYLKEMMATSDAPQTADMQSGGITTPRISLKGMKFRFKEGGEELAVVKDDLDVVIVGMLPIHGCAKTYYEGEYQPDSSDPPDCSSTDGVRPDTWISNPVNNLCATCKNNKFGSAISMAGKKSKACRDSRRLYIVRAKEMKDTDEPKVWLLNVTVSSLKPLNTYSKELSKKGITTPSVVVTRLNFDDDSDFPKLTFAVVGTLNENMAKVSLAIAHDKDWDIPQSAVSAEIAEKVLIEGKVEPEKQAEGDSSVVAEQPKREATEAVEDILSKW